jgi:hypothetical protein
MVVASALFVSTAVVFAASPANAAGTGSMVDNGDGSMTVTWTASAPDSVLINFYPSGATCPQFADGINVSFEPRIGRQPHNAFGWFLGVGWAAASTDANSCGAPYGVPLWA